VVVERPKALSFTQGMMRLLQLLIEACCAILVALQPVEARAQADACRTSRDCAGERLCYQASCVKPPALTVSTPQAGQSVSGDLPIEAVRHVVDAHLRSIRRCYAQALLAEPSTTGSATFDWTIGADGSVVEATPKSSSLSNDELLDCIRRSLLICRFAQHGGGPAIVSYQFVFTNGDGAPNPWAGWRPGPVGDFPTPENLSKTALPYPMTHPTPPGQPGPK
jgi:hypothetical protein